MRRGLSLYLDLLRFSLAMVVFLGHASYRGYVGHPYIFWFLITYAQTAVMGFFVLSGYVIAYVASNKEHDPKIYTIARISRLYSIIIPALILTAILDASGSHFNPGLYSSGPSPLGDHQIERYVATLFLIHRTALFSADMSPGTNGPFWSLGLEATYYLVFGLFIARKPVLAAIGTVIVLCVAGRSTTELFPCWLLGVLVFHLQKWAKVNRWLALAVFVLSWAAIAKVGWLRHTQQFVDDHALALYYAEATLFAVNIFAAANMTRTFEWMLGHSAGAVHWLGSLTFSLYLCHRPLLQFLTAIKVSAPGTLPQQVWLFGMIAIVTIAVASFGEQFRVLIRRVLSEIVPPLVAQEVHGTSADGEGLAKGLLAGAPDSSVNP